MIQFRTGMFLQTKGEADAKLIPLYGETELGLKYSRLVFLRHIVVDLRFFRSIKEQWLLKFTTCSVLSGLKSEDLHADTVAAAVCDQRHCHKLPAMSSCRGHRKPPKGIDKTACVLCLFCMVVIVLCAALWFEFESCTNFFHFVHITQHLEPCANRRWIKRIRHVFFWGQLLHQPKHQSNLHVISWGTISTYK